MGEFKGTKPRIRFHQYPYTEQKLWQVSLPGEYYLLDEGFNFNTWEEAMSYALTYWENKQQT